MTQHASGLNQAQVAEALSFARQLMAGAGEIALRYFRRAVAVDNKLADGRFDPVTTADREVEAFLRGELAKRYPGFAIVGEEGGTTAGDTDLRWLIDPIDGTKAFISGMPTWGILLGLQQGEQVLAGLMYQPATGELFTAANGRGELRQRGRITPLASRPTRRLDEAILYCTHDSMFADTANLAAFRRIAERSRLQRFGGDCYAYCMLALGQIDLVVEDTLQPYDIVPLVPIIEAAGGVVTDAAGNTPLNGGFVIAAATPELHAEAMALL
jgi:myo-inositol-1(or 4)-monophosphatase